MNIIVAVMFPQPTTNIIEPSSSLSVRFLGEKVKTTTYTVHAREALPSFGTPKL